MASKKAATKGNAQRVIGYVRVSTDEQHLGPVAQRAALEAWCAARGAELVAVFEDLGVSGGAPLEDRPGLALALDALVTQGAGVLLVSKRDRLARSVMVAAYVDATAAKHGATVASVAGEGEGDDPAAALMRTIVDAFAQYERGIIAARTKAAMGIKRQRGEAMGAAPFGKRWADEGGVFVDDEAEQATIARARQLRASGASLRAIAATLAAEGLHSRNGKPFAASAVHAMLAADAA